MSSKKKSSRDSVHRERHHQHESRSSKHSKHSEEKEHKKRSGDSEEKHRKKKKLKDNSPVVKKINEISDSSDEDIREKLKRLYDEDPSKGKQVSKEDEELKAKYKKWGKGLKQVEEREKRLADEEYEMSKPLARYKDDQDLDKHLREQELIDDPMLEYFRKRKEEKEQQDEYEKTGEVWVMPKYKSKVPPPINRYNIWPGYRWDGVDRGNGFEARLLAKRNEKQANEEEDYKYDTFDL